VRGAKAVENEHKRFERSLDGVARRLNVPYRTVVGWRDNDGCGALAKGPYDIEAIQIWLGTRAGLTTDPKSSLDRKKLEAEVRKLHREERVFTRDKAFWVAVVALGISVSREVREWLSDRRSQLESEEREGIELNELMRRLRCCPSVANVVCSFRSSSPVLRVCRLLVTYADGHAKRTLYLPASAHLFPGVVAMALDGLRLWGPGKTGSMCCNPCAKYEEGISPFIQKGPNGPIRRRPM
jgi:hypothetical protein